MKTSAHLLTAAAFMFLTASAGRAATGSATATADLDARDYRLAVASAHGAPTPPAGVSVYAWRAAVSCAVDEAVTAGSATQYVCTGWAGTGSAPASGSDTNVSFTITEDSSVAWQWRTNYWLEAAASGSGGVAGGGGAWVAAGSNVVLTAEPAAGWHFAGWTGDVPEGLEAANPLELTLDRPRSVSAAFALNTYAVTATAGPRGSVSPAGVTQVPHGGSQAYAVTPDAHCHVAEVLVDGASVGAVTAYTFENVTNAHTLAASFAADTYAVAFDLGAHGTRTGGGGLTQEVGYGSAADAPEVSAEAGWTFSGWDAAFGYVTNALTVRALYERVTNAVTVASAHGEPVPAAGEHPYAWGDTAACSVTGVETLGATQHVCTGWAGTGSAPASGTGTNVSFAVTNDSSVAWQWQTNYWLGAAASGNGGVAGTGWYAAGSNAVLTATPAEGWHFAGWTGDVPEGLEAANPLELTLDRPRSVSAAFAADTYAVVFDLGAHGTRTGGGELTQVVEHGSAAEAPEVLAEAGWTFSGWDAAFGYVTNALTVRALYERVTNAVTVASAHGEPVPAAGEHPYAWGDTAACSVTGVETLGATQYVCTGWAGTGSAPASGSDTNVSFAVTNDSSVVWQWRTNYWLEAAASGSGGVAGGGGAWVAAGSNVVLTAEPAAGWHFAGWTGDVPEGLEAANPLELTLDRPRSVSAAFALNTYAVAFDLGAHGTRTGGGGLTQEVGYGSAADAPEVSAEAGWTFSGWDAAFGYVTNALTVRALYERVTNAVTVASAHGEPVPAAGEHPYAWGDTAACSVTGVETLGATQYVCTGWAGTGSAPASGSDTNVSFAVTNDSSVVWQWRTNYWLEAAASGSGGVAGTGWYAAGSDAVLTATSAEGWHFAGWTGDVPEGLEAANPLELTLDRPRSVSAAFAPNTYAVAFDLGAHGTRTGGGGLTQEVGYGSAADAPEVSAEAGWTFSGWDAAFGYVTNALTVRALYERVTNAVTVASAHGEPVPAAGEHPYAWGDTAACSVTGVETLGATQHVCTGWAGTGSAPASGIETNVSFAVTNDSSVAWQWQTNYWLEVAASGNGGVTGTGWCAAGSNVVLTAEPAEGYTFVEWRGDTNGCEIAGVQLTAVMDRPRTVSAVFAPCVFFISAACDEHATISPGSQWIEYGHDIAFTIQCETGYHIEEVIVDGDVLPPTNRVEFLNVREPHFVYATVAVNRYALTVLSAFGGASPGSVVENHGVAVSQEIVNSPVVNGATQHVCVGASVIGNDSVQVTPTHVTLTLTNNATLVWLWQTQYRLTTDTNGCGEVTSGGWHAENSHATVVAVAAQDWHFSAWSGDTNGCTLATNVLTAPMTEARNIVALFERDNRPPAIEAVADRQIEELVPLVFTVEAVDPDAGSVLTFGLGPDAPDGAAIDAETGVFSWTPSEAQGPGSYEIEVVVTDNGAPPLSDSRRFAVTVNEVNQRPLLTVPADVSMDEQTTLTVTNRAADADIPANALTFALVSGPAWVSLNPADGVITLSPAEADGPGTNTVVVSVTDNGTPPLGATNSFKVVVNEVNQAPVLPVVEAQTGYEQNELVVANSATDADLPENALGYALLDPPAGASIDSDGLIRWTPAHHQAPGMYTFTTVVTDDNPWASVNQRLSATNAFTVQVLAVNHSPVLEALPDRTVDELSALTFSACASDPDDGDVLTYRLEAGAPAGAVIDAHSGVFSWTPSEAQGPGTYTLTVTVTDNGSVRGVADFSDSRSFRVDVGEVNSRPVLNRIPDRVVTPGESVVLRASAADADLPFNTLTYELLTVSLAEPPFEEPSFDTQTGDFSWTPLGSDLGGVFFFVVTATDNGTPPLSSSRVFRMEVVAPTSIGLVTIDGHSPVRLRWASVPGLWYQVQVKTNLSDPQWIDLGAPIAAVGDVCELYDGSSATVPQRFYRVVLLQ
jgi:hypothetical protein